MIMFSVILSLLLMSCSQPSTSSNANRTLSELDLIVLGSSTFTGDSLVIEISANDMPTWRRQWPGIPTNPRLSAIVPGENRQIRAWVFLDGDTAMSGLAQVDLSAGSTSEVFIELQALKGILELGVPVGMDNSMGIHSGKLIMSYESQQDTIMLQGGIPRYWFSSKPVPFEMPIVIDVSLFDEQNNLLYRAQDTLVFSIGQPYIQLELESMSAQIGLSMRLLPDPKVTGVLRLPGSISRSPRALWELIITEIMPNPKVSGNDYEWIEVYNATLDTLLLDSCRIAKDRNTTGSTTSTSLLTGVVIAPASYFVFGRDSVSFANDHYSGLVLSNTAQSLVLACNRTLIDSIAYWSSTDSINPFPLAESKSMQAPLSLYAQRNLGTTWCLGQDSISLGFSWKMWGSPNREANCLN